jgi:hypothetical protein
MFPSKRGWLVIMAIPTLLCLGLAAQAGPVVKEWSAMGMAAKDRRDYIVKYLTENAYKCPVPVDETTKKPLTVAQQEEKVDYTFLPWPLVYGYVVEYCTQKTDVAGVAKPAQQKVAAKVATFKKKKPDAPTQVAQVTAPIAPHLVKVEPIKPPEPTFEELWQSLKKD